VLHLTTQSPHAPHGVKGAGEGGTLAPGAAIANAISDALNAECNELPATPPKIIDLMRHAGRAASARSAPIGSGAACAAISGSETHLGE
jgi:carbon-monoxide dehydrogenase large subunit